MEISTIVLCLIFVISWILCGVWASGQMSRDLCSSDEEYRHVKNVAFAGGMVSVLTITNLTP
jgi:hypothetical protein